MTVDAWLVEVRRQGKSPRTVQMCRTLLATAMQEAVRRRVIDTNPVKLATRPRVPAPEPRYLTLDEARRLLAIARGQPGELGVGVALAIHLGLRRGEILGLSVRDVDLLRGTVYVHRNLVRVRAEGGGRRGWELVLGPTKTARSRRRLPLPGGLARWLEEDLEARRRSTVAAGRPAPGPDDPVVSTAAGGRMDPDNFSKAVGRLGRRAGLDGVHPHLLRHTCATLLLDEGVDLAVVAAVLGHSTVVLTATIYANVLDRTKREGLGLLDGLLTEDATGTVPANLSAEPIDHP